jgi:Rrf2 family protein
MKISKKAQYAMRAVLAIARHPGTRPVQISDLSKSELIPVKFLEQILLTLKKGGLLRSKRGAAGGYFLNKSPGDIPLVAILELIDGSFEPLGNDQQNNPSLTIPIGLEQCFSQLRDLVNDHLGAHSIQDLLDLERADDILAFEI